MLVQTYNLFYSAGWNSCMSGKSIESVLGGVDDWHRVQANRVSYVSQLFNRYDVMSGYFGALFNNYKQRKGMLL